MTRLGEGDCLVATVGNVASPEPYITEFATRHVRAKRRQSLYFVFKRIMDLCIASLALIVLLPLLPLIAVAIKLDSRGPVLFTQERVGARRRKKNGKTVWELTRFRCYKFRSMFNECDESVHRKYTQQFCSGSKDAMRSVPTAKFKLSNDRRVTRVGRALRKASLDELPQLLNVLKGEMSVVGPRPVPIYEVQMYDTHHYKRLAATPGITGLWQIKGRGRVQFRGMIQLDIEYTHKCSIWLDLKILCLTVPAVLSGRGAC
jgi:lipopolysaccharide/colanic/teichoic acid biosynthesis glycosyltransferase